MSEHEVGVGLLARQVREGEMDSSEAGRRANLLQIAKSLSASLVHKQLRELTARLVDAKVLPASALKTLQARL